MLQHALLVAISFETIEAFKACLLMQEKKRLQLSYRYQCLQLKKPVFK
jgi:hypothetical protein